MNATTIKHIEVTVPLSPAYASAWCTLEAVQTSVTIPLIEGDHVINTPAVVIGHLRNVQELPITAHLTVKYSYNAADDMITLCESELADEKATYLTTTLEKTPHTPEQSCIQYAYDHPQHPYKRHPNWSYSTPLTPGLEDLLQQTVKQANDMIIDAAKKSDLNVAELSPLPPLTKEVFEQLSVVYHKGEFAGFYDPSKQYGADYHIETIFSTFGAKVKFKNKQPFANVIGSTGDPHIKKMSWIALWESCFGDVEICSSYQFMGFVCNDDKAKIYGGHVLLGNTAAHVKHGKNGIVYIIPICENHNNDDSVYMEPLEYDQAVMLNKYHKKGP